MTGWVAGASIVGAAIGAYGNMSAADKAAKAGKRADPFGKYRRFYGDELKNMWQNPGSILENPAFRASMDFGLHGVARTMASQGFLGSGNEAAALMDYGQTHALSWLDNQQKFLAELAGAGTNGAGTQVQAAQASNGMFNQGMGQLGSLLGMFGGMGGGGGGGGFSMPNDGGFDWSITGL